MRTTVAAAVACLIAISLSHADDIHAAVKKETNIPAQGLGPALRDLAKERDFQIVYVSEDVNGRRTSGATGQLTTPEALTKLLDGTGLAYRHVDDNTITVYPIPAGGGQPQAESKSSPTNSTKEVPKSFWQRLRLAQAETRGTTGSSEAGSTDDRSDLKRLMLEEVIVTAQKREERIRDVPMSIAALTGDQLDRSTGQGVSDALDALAGVYTLEGRSGMGSQITIRGVAPSDALLGGANPVAYYLDSVPFGFARHGVTPDAGAFDLERVEVLRGPQGTLYGANALNGVVRILTHDPEFNEFEFKGRAGLSSTKYTDNALNHRSDAALNVPLVDDKLAMRVTAGYQKFAGWLDKPNDADANDSEQANFRVKLKAQPTDRLTLNLSVGVSRQDYDAYSIGLSDRTQPLSPQPEPQAADYELYAGTITYDFALTQLRSSTSYMDFQGRTPLDFGPFGLPWIVHTELDATVLAHESVLNSLSEGPWKWSLGVFYRDAKDRTFQPVTDYPAGDPVVTLDWRDISKSHAIFGEVTRELVKGFELTTGLRYFRDRVRIEDIAGLTPDDSVNFEAWSPRVVLTWKPSNELMTYVSFSKGFRSGMIQVPDTAALGVPPARPDKLYNYELGTKLDVMGGMLGFEAAVYYIDWQDVLLTGVPVTGSSGVETTATTNAAGADGVGFDFSVNLHPARGLTLRTSVGWNDLRYTSDVVLGAPLASKGDRVFLSPKLTASGSAAYEFGLGSSDLTGTVSASAQYVSEFYFSTPGTPKFYSDPQFIGRLSFGILTANRWEGTLYVDNVTNEQGISVPDAYGIAQWSGRARPRTIGAQFAVQF